MLRVESEDEDESDSVSQENGKDPKLSLEDEEEKLVPNSEDEDEDYDFTNQLSTLTMARREGSLIPQNLKPVHQTAYSLFSKIVSLLTILTKM